MTDCTRRDQRGPPLLPQVLLVVRVHSKVVRPSQTDRAHSQLPRIFFGICMILLSLPAHDDLFEFGR